MSYFSDIEYKKKDNLWFEQYLFGSFFSGIEGKILDIGCATGNYLSLNPEMVEGVDIDEDALRQARERGLTVHNSDANAGLPGLPENFYSAVFAKHVIEHLSDPLNFLRGVKRVLKPGGRAVITTPNCPYVLKRNFYDDYTHIRPFTGNSLKMIAYDAGFSDVKVTEDFRCLPGLGRIIRLFKLQPQQIRKLENFIGLRGLSLIMEIKK